MKEKFEASEEEKRLRSMMKQYEAPDMTALQEQKLWVLLREEADKKRLAPDRSMWRQKWRLAKYIPPSVWM